MDHPTIKDPDEVFKIISDTERLQEADKSLLFHVRKSLVQKDDLFVLDLPYKEIHEWVLKEKEKVFSNLPDEVKAKLQWEHVGSTSIPGMPGAFFPDSLILTQSFPPPKEIVTSLMANGYNFAGAGPWVNFEDDLWDIWFVSSAICEPGHVMDGKYHKIHLTKVSDHGPGRLVELRDRRITDKEEFENYKQTKMEAAKHLDSETPNILAYKKSKYRNKESGSVLLFKEINQKYKMSKRSVN